MSEVHFPLRDIEAKIYIVRGQKVMLDEDLAVLYGVPTGQLNRAVRRNIDRFPSDFMFSLTDQEVANLKCQIGISSFNQYGGRRSFPYAFTQEGVSMLSCVLRSKRAIQVNVTIMRAFVRLREMAISHKELAQKIDEVENKYDQQFKVVFDALRRIFDSKIGVQKKISGLNRGK